MRFIEIILINGPGLVECHNLVGWVENRHNSFRPHFQKTACIFIGGYAAQLLSIIVELMFSKYRNSFVNNKHL